MQYQYIEKIRELKNTPLFITMEKPTHQPNNFLIKSKKIEINHFLNIIH